MDGDESPRRLFIGLFIWCPTMLAGSSEVRFDNRNHARILPKISCSRTLNMSHCQIRLAPQDAAADARLENGESGRFDGGLMSRGMCPPRRNEGTILVAPCGRGRHR
ncbi:hypothetical protein CYLTODRAFT_183795 [Cylindrobasidium torrendii FP15055 ss-10]|uniref:FHA domain-containing protein n=1 Tax=Cylindrobasidium torrendii FP15055 ss-10 TaxID=1314674 RepID=A0A0D7BIW9_9AGAR|nr:hypothetical protein CYLTODRAFT_183795 [Cylindrobasidium torrendii FP15055 ss-10]